MRVNWSTVPAAYAPILATHWRACQALGLDCPLEVFEELFYEHHDDADSEEVCRGIDWARVTWDEVELSGVALRNVAVDRGYRYAGDEARWATAEEGIDDDRPDVLTSRREHKTRMRPPVVVTGDATGCGYHYELLVGFTRLGNLLGLLGGRDMPETMEHRAWLGCRRGQPR